LAESVSDVLAHRRDACHHQNRYARIPFTTLAGSTPVSR
jgi:hypothetical protein